MMKKLILSEGKKIGIVYRPETPRAFALGAEVAVWLKEKGYAPVTAPDQKKITGTQSMSAKDLKSLCLIVVLGGDGTYLQAVRLLEGAPIPILGVNLGSLGFLTQTREQDLYVNLEQALNNKMELRSRSMLEVKLKRKNKVIDTSLALNDVVIERGAASHLMNVAIYSEKFLVCEIKADGFIIASPTGSTAYTLAAGGPVLHPEVNALVVTPIAPHSLTTRPMIFPDHQLLSFKINSRTQGSRYVVDGKSLQDLVPDDEIVITRAKHDHLVVRRPTDNFFHLLREKLKFGERA
ncbi:MAG: NAD(+)/NADH kinase [Pseudobdellovibrionaceae bacterium]